MATKFLSPSKSPVNDLQRPQHTYTQEGLVRALEALGKAVEGLKAVPQIRYHVEASIRDLLYEFKNAGALPKGVSFGFDLTLEGQDLFISWHDERFVKWLRPAVEAMEGLKKLK